MYKIMLTVRNRLAITKKCITALYKHAAFPFQLYVYDNLTTIKIKEHFEYFYKLYEAGYITELTFATKDSTFNAFSKAVSSNKFGRLHLEDPHKDNCDFLLFLDNDIIVTKNFDKKLTRAWEDVKMKSMNHIKIISQYPGGIRHTIPCEFKIAGFHAVEGKLGGSGFWSVRPNFFEDIGFLNLKTLVRANKKHDQYYWKILSTKCKNREYILGLKDKLCLHCGKDALSMCNVLTQGQGTFNDKIKEKLLKSEIDIDKIPFDEFYQRSLDNKDISNNW